MYIRLEDQDDEREEGTSRRYDGREGKFFFKRHHYIMDGYRENGIFLTFLVVFFFFGLCLLHGMAYGIWHIF